ncbi:MAG: hypothetical protein HZB39_05840 [Planctomycetes bacterium]|nr:hypothetical protein [Planctomycetota bacterium]
MTTRHFVVALFASSLLQAQAVVSPRFCAATEANYDNSLPFGYGGDQQSYQQIHADLAGLTASWSSLSFRRDGFVATNAAFAPKTFTADLWFGTGVPIAAVSATYANNWTSTPSRVVTGRAVNMPSWVQRPSPMPAAFDVVVPLDAPYLWNGASQFLWEMRVTNQALTHPMFADAHRGPWNSDSSGSLPYGNAPFCVATGQTGAYLASSSFVINGASLDATFGCSLGVANGPATILIGALSQDFAIPGLCGRLLVDPLVNLDGVADATGAMTFTLSVPFTTALAYTPIFAQSVCLDALRADPIPAAISRGAANTIPWGRAPVCVRVYHPGDATATVGFLDPSNTNLGSVIRLN